MSVSSTASLTALPTELLSLIASKIASKSTLCHLARCSRQLHLSTIPHLYRRIKLQEDEEQRDKKLIMLTASLLRRPDLARLVRQFSLHVLYSYQGKTFNLNGAFATAFDPSGLSQGEVINFLEQYDHTDISRHDFILSFLLPSLLKVEKLVLDVEISIHSQFLGEALRKAVARERPLDTQPSFEMLKVFAQSPNYYSKGRKLEFLALLLKLPAIQEITGLFVKMEGPHEGYYDDGFDKEKFADSTLKELDSSSSPLTSLELATKDVPAVDMCHILRVPIALKKFSFLASSLYDIDCTNLPHALEPQKNSLESMTIYCSPRIQSARGEDYDFAPMGSFTRFSALKVFKTEGLFLTETVHGNDRYSLLNMFPPSLETLHLTRFQTDFNKLLEALERLLASKSAWQIPSLNNLILEETVYRRPSHTRLMEILLGDTQEVATEKLSGVARSQNVAFEVIEESACKASSQGVWEGLIVQSN